MLFYANATGIISKHFLLPATESDNQNQNSVVHFVRFKLTLHLIIIICKIFSLSKSFKVHFASIYLCLTTDREPKIPCSIHRWPTIALELNKCFSKAFCAFMAVRSFIKCRTRKRFIRKKDVRILLHREASKPSNVNWTSKRPSKLAFDGENVQSCSTNVYSRSGVHSNHAVLFFPCIFLNSS